MRSLQLVSVVVLVLQSQPGSPVVRHFRRAQLREHIRPCRRSFEVMFALVARGRTHDRLPGIVDLKTVQIAIILDRGGNTGDFYCLYLSLRSAFGKNGALILVEKSTGV